MKTLIILIGFLFIFSTNAAALTDIVDHNKMGNNIIRSIQETPNHWIDTGHYFVYFKDKAKLKTMKEIPFPEVNGDIVLTYSFYHTYKYISLYKPFDYNFKGEALENIITEIKLYKLRNLKKEVGNLLDHLAKKPAVEPEVKEEQLINMEEKLEPL